MSTKTKKSPDNTHKLNRRAICLRALLALIILLAIFLAPQRSASTKEPPQDPAKEKTEMIAPNVEVLNGQAIMPFVDPDPDQPKTFILVVCSVAFGGALLHFGAPAERVEAEEARLSGVQEHRTRGAQPMPDPTDRGTPSGFPGPLREPSQEQVDSRAGSLAAEPGNAVQDPDAQARALLEESEERVEDPAAREPDDQRVIRRQSGEGVTAD
jgi:hypothetical protein